MWALLVLLAVVGVSVFAYDFIEYQFERRVLYAQTHIAVERCIQANRSEVVSERIIRNLCAAAESRSVTDDSGQFNGRAAPNDSFGYSFNGHVVNNFSNKIVTEYEVRMVHYITDIDVIDPDIASEIPEIKASTVTIENVWIEPGQRDDFVIDDSELDFIPDMDIYDNEGVEWSWFVSNIKGIDVSIR